MNVNYAGVQISDIFKIRDVRRSILPERENSFIEVPSRHGAYYSGYSYKPRLISLDILMISDDLNANMRSLAWMLDLHEPSELIIDDEPNRVWYAVLNGSTDFQTILTVGTGTLEFICYDPMAFNTESYTFSADSNGSMTIVNGGTAPISPLFDISFESDCTFCAVVSPDGVVQIGQPKNVDEPILPKSELLVNDGMSALTNWVTNTGGKIRYPTNGIIQGSVMSNNFNVRVNSYSTDRIGTWFGPTIKHTIKNSANGDTAHEFWEATCTFKFQSDDWFSAQPLQKQMGRLEFNVLTEAGDLLCGFTMRDSTENYAFAIPEFHVGSGTSPIWSDNPVIPAPKIVKQYNKKTKKYENKSIPPTTVGKYNTFFGKVIIRRSSGKFYFELQQIDQNSMKVLSRASKTYYDGGEIYTGIRAKSLCISFLKYSTSPFMGLMYVDNVTFRRDNVSEYHLVPNLFHEGDILTIDNDSNQVYLNDSLFMDKVDIGSNFFQILEGETQIQLVHNAEGTPPTMTATIVEKFM